MDVQRQIRTYIVENFLLGDAGDLDEARSLSEAGVIDSTGFWSTNYLSPGYVVRFLASRFYHRLHIAQLEAMFRATGESLFLTYSRRWSA